MRSIALGVPGDHGHGDGPADGRRRREPAIGLEQCLLGSLPGEFAATFARGGGQGLPAPIVLHERDHVIGERPLITARREQSSVGRRAPGLAQIVCHGRPAGSQVLGHLDHGRGVVQTATRSRIEAHVGLVQELEHPIAADPAGEVDSIGDAQAHGLTFDRAAFRAVPDDRQTRIDQLWEREQRGERRYTVLASELADEHQTRPSGEDNTRGRRRGAASGRWTIADDHGPLRRKAAAILRDALLGGVGHERQARRAECAALSQLEDSHQWRIAELLVEQLGGQIVMVEDRVATEQTCEPRNREQGVRRIVQMEDVRTAHQPGNSVPSQLNVCDQVLPDQRRPVRSGIGSPEPDDADALDRLPPKLAADARRHTGDLVTSGHQALGLLPDSDVTRIRIVLEQHQHACSHCRCVRPAHQFAPLPPSSAGTVRASRRTSPQNE